MRASTTSARPGGYLGLGYLGGPREKRGRSEDAEAEDQGFDLRGKMRMERARNLADPEEWRRQRGEDGDEENKPLAAELAVDVADGLEWVVIVAGVSGHTKGEYMGRCF